MTPEALNNYLTSLEMSPSEFANLIGVTPGAVAHWLSGRRDVPKMIVKIIEYFEDDIRSFK